MPLSGPPALLSAVAAAIGDLLAATDTSKYVTPYAYATVTAYLRNALAPAQALSGNGTAGSALVNGQAFGAGDHSWAYIVNVTSFADTNFLHSGDTNAQIAAILTDGSIVTGRRYGATNTGSAAGSVALNAPTFIGYTRSGTTTTGKYYVNGVVVATITDALDYSGVLAAIGKQFGGSQFFSGTLRLIGTANRTMSPAEMLAAHQTGSFPASDFGASGAPAGTTVTAGAFVVGKKYRILTVGTTSFTGVGASANTVGVEFVATGVGSGTGTALAIGLIVCPNWAGYTGGPQVLDVSGNGADLNLPGDGVTGGVVPAIPGATPSPFRATRTSSGYLIGDQVVIPPGCSVEVWAKGNGTFSLGDSSGTPTSIVNAQTAPTNLSPITQAGYVTATRKLYLTLGTATSVTVRVVFHAV